MSYFNIVNPTNFKNNEIDSLEGRYLLNQYKKKLLKGGGKKKIKKKIIQDIQIFFQISKLI